LTTNVLLISAGFFHPPWLGRFWLRQALEAMPDIAFKQAASLEVLPSTNIQDFQAIILFIHQQVITPKTLNVLDQFVSQGGGLLAIHSATASFKNESRYYDILGGRFTRHGPLSELAIRPVKADDEIFSGIEAFSLYEEPYEHEIDPGCEIHFDTPHPQSPEADRLPVVWTYLYGQGRVCYCLPGHRPAAMRHPAVREILRRGLKWVCQPTPSGGPAR